MHHLRLFGRPHLLGPDGSAIPFRTGKQLALLIYLALEARNRPVSRDKLIDLFWPDVPPKSGRHSLSEALTAIRAKLGRDAVTRARKEVQLVAPLTTDLDAGAGDALSPQELRNPLEDLEQYGGHELSHWVDQVRDRCLTDIKGRLLDEVSAARSGGQVARVHEVAEQLYVIDPQNDVAALAVAERYVMRGDTSGAIAFLRRHTKAADAEFKREVSKQVTWFLRRVERGQVPLTENSAELEGASFQTAAQREVFVGREEESSRLEALWAKARDGGLATCLISGPAGIGKSTLVMRFATALLARGWAACMANCQEMGRKIPFATVSDLTYKLARDPELGATDPQWLAEVSRVTPGLRALYTGIPEPHPTPADAVRIRVADALFSMLTAVADAGPILLVLDDIQYMDPASREVLHLLGQRLASTPTLVLGTIRCAGPVRSMIGAGASEVIDWHEEVRLLTMGVESTKEMIRGLSAVSEVPDAVCDRMADLSQGNPYLTEMLLSDWRNNGNESLVSMESRGSTRSAQWHPPETMHNAFAQQYKGLSRDTEHVLHLLAVAERPIPIAEIETLLALAPGVADRAALELIDRAIVRTSGGAFGFRNQPHRAFVYSVMSDEARTYHHGRLARSLTATREERDFQRALEASSHYLKAGMTEEAMEAACLGADLAITHGAPREAERALNAVLPSSPPPAGKRVQILLARALSAQQRFRDSLHALPDQITYSDSREPAISLMIRAEASHRCRLSDTSTVARMVKDAIREATREENRNLAISGYQLLAEIAHENEWWDEMRKVESQCRRLIRNEKSAETRAMAHHTLGYCRLMENDVRTAIRSLSYSRVHFELLGQDARLHRSLNGLGMCYTNIGHYKDAVPVLQGAAAVADRMGDAVCAANARSNLAGVYTDMGLFEDAALQFRCALAAAAACDNARVPTAIYCNASGLSMILGNFAEAQEFLDLAEQSAKRARIWQHTVSALLNRADLLLAMAEPDVAWPLVEEAVSITSSRVHLVPDCGQYWRLRTYLAWSLQSHDSIELSEPPPWTLCRPGVLAHKLQIEAFRQWISEKNDSDVASAKPLQILLNHGLFGVIARLAATGVILNPLPEPLDSEASASLVARAFPEQDFGKIPSGIR
jgi:DNA-binding SARP family transcriptional activator/tetratricopeptide (TPR) repeat protein